MSGYSRGFVADIVATLAERVVGEEHSVNGVPMVLDFRRGWEASPRRVRQLLSPHVRRAEQPADQDPDQILADLARLQSNDEDGWEWLSWSARQVRAVDRLGVEMGRSRPKPKPHTTKARFGGPCSRCHAELEVGSVIRVQDEVAWHAEHDDG